MTGRTLEEIEREIAKLGSQKWYGAAHTLRILAIAQGQREEMARLKRLVKMALLEGVAIGTHREDLTEPWENGERAWNGSKASEEVNMAIGTKK